MSFAWVLGVTLPLFAGGAILMAFASAGAPRDVRSARWLKFTTYAMIVHLVIGVALLGTPSLVALGLLVTLAGAREIWRAVEPLRGSRAAPLIKVGYVAICAAFVLSMRALEASTVVFVYLVVAGFDGFSQVVGQLVGRLPLAPRLSPHKTVEGLLGGLLAAAVIAVALAALVGMSRGVALASGALVGACALAGDLCASWVKRRSGIKDFGKLLPGQGGILDRFDSFIVAGALAGPLLGSLDSG